MAKIYVDQTAPNFVVAEIWSSIAYESDGKSLYNQDDNHNELAGRVQTVQGSTTTFDFTAKGILQAAVQGELWLMIDPNGKAPGLLRILPEKAVTFVDNHDTGSTQQLWSFLSDKVMQGYAYILTHPRIPSILDLGIIYKQKYERKQQAVPEIISCTRNHLEENSQVMGLLKRHRPTKQKRSTNVYHMRKPLSNLCMSPIHIFLPVNNEGCEILGEKVCISKFFIDGSRNPFKTRTLIFLQEKSLFRDSVRVQVIYGGEGLSFPSAILSDSILESNFKAVYSKLLIRANFLTFWVAHAYAMWRVDV